ncbi:MAG: hypothetical protein AAF204_00140 [Pseudomonadota bacterium]
MKDKSDTFSPKFQRLLSEAQKTASALRKDAKEMEARSLDSPVQGAELSENFNEVYMNLLQNKVARTAIVRRNNKGEAIDVHIFGNVYYPFPRS